LSKVRQVLSRRTFTRPRTLVVAAVAAPAVAVPVAWAAHDFTDVPDSHPFHDPISAMKGSGITVGCGPSIYCPADFVRRDQMAGFLHRGLGRVAEDFFEAVAIPDDYADGAVGTVDITTGVPASAPDANGFIKADAVIEISRANAVGCPCTYTADLGLDFLPFITDGPSVRFTVNDPGQYTIPLTGAIPADTGLHTVEVLVEGPAGATASGYVTATYLPFGPTGTNVGLAGAAGGKTPSGPRPRPTG
jgi:hypothetical protein